MNKIMQILKLEEINKQDKFSTKSFEISMPARGKEIKIKHNFQIDESNRYCN